ncbi:MAG: hypothetical protein V1822_02455, partial [Candidatus Micrarchaeota archaeon]
VEKYSGFYAHASDALARLDRALQEEFGLVPKTAKIEKDILRLENLKNLNGNAKNVEKKMKVLKGQKKLLNNLLKFEPLSMNHEYEKYYIFRVNASRSSRIFTKKFSTKKMRMKN